MRRKQEQVKEKALRACGYCRVSTKEQQAEGHSLGAQEQAIRTTASARGWRLEQVFVDPGETGASLDRPGLKALLAQVEAEQVDVVLVAALDRLSRRQRHLLALREDLFERHHVALVSLREAVDCTTAAGRAMFGVMGVFGELERDLLKERTVNGLREARKRGRTLGAAPYGYRRILRDDTDPFEWATIAGDDPTLRSVLVKDEEQQKALHRARRLRAQGLTLRDIAKRMGWHHSSVAYRLGYRPGA